MTETSDRRDKVTELVRDARLCMLTTMTADGRHVSRPMALQEAEFDGDLWFFCYADSDKAAEIRLHPEVNVSFSTKTSWVSISGAAEQVSDRAKAEQLWNPILKAWFPDGLDTPGVTLLKVHAHSAEYWESAHSSRVVELLGYAKAAVTKRPPNAGENEEVSL